MKKSYALGNVTIDRDTCGGGLIGYCNGAEIEDCYAKGDVISTGTGTGNTAGLIGCAENSSVKNSYSKGKVSADSAENPTISGFIGGGASDTTVLNCYYDKTASLQA